MKVERTDKPYTRKNVREDKESMYIFTDNTDRDSGKSLIPNTSWYSHKYGEGKHYPSMTTALILLSSMFWIISSIMFLVPATYALTYIPCIWSVDGRSISPSSAHALLDCPMSTKRNRPKAINF